MQHVTLKVKKWPNFQEVEEAPFLWFLTIQAKKAIITNTILNLGKGNCALRAKL
jgi:hypothetical protein